MEVPFEFQYFEQIAFDVREDSCESSLLQNFVRERHVASSLEYHDIFHPHYSSMNRRFPMNSLRLAFENDCSIAKHLFLMMIQEVHCANREVQLNLVVTIEREYYRLLLTLLNFQQLFDPIRSKSNRFAETC